MAEKRLDWIDNARGIAIILVVMWYVVSSYHEAGLYESNTFYNFISHFIYSFHMALFMLISGYLCTLKKSKNNTAKGKKILRKLVCYGIPYILFPALWVLMKMLMSSVTNSAVSLKDLIEIPIYPISFMWFIYALLIMQVIQILIGEKSRVFKAGHLIAACGGIV